MGATRSLNDTNTHGPAISDDDVQTLPEVLVPGFKLTRNSYSAPNATTATKLNTPIMQTPLSIQVVSKSVLEDQQATTVLESLDNVSGVFPSFGFNGFDTFIVRGFRTFDLFRDGFRLPTGLSTTGEREIANLSKIEVVKGPASILFGRIEPGGLVNAVTKNPEAKPYYSLQQQIGSFDLYRTTLDATGGLNQYSSLLYRFNFAYENSDSFRDFGDSDRIFVAPVLQWKISERTQVTVEMEYKNGEAPLDYGVPAIGNRPADLPIRRNLGEEFSRIEFEEILSGFNWSHAFNDNWEIKNRFYYYYALENDNAINNGSLQADNQTLDRSYFGLRDNETTTYSTDLNLTGKIETFGIQHTVLVGGDYYSTNSEGLSIGSSSAIPSINIFNPTHFNTIPIQDPALDFGFDSSQEWFGLYVQDQIELPYDVHILAGFRYDDAKIESKDTFAKVTTITKSKDDQISPRFGLLWRPIQEVSFYGNYVENLGLPNAFNSPARNGIPLQAETAQQWEAGIKTELLNGRLSATVAWFQITKQNVVTPDPDPVLAALGAFRQTGEAQNEGIELDVTGELLPGWKVIANYAYTDTDITKANDGTLGNRLPGVPKHAGNIWTTYAIQNTALKGLTLGGGVTLRGEREGNNDNDFQLPGYTLFNLMTRYTLQVSKSQVTAQFNVRNLFDIEYFPSSTSRSFIAVGAPRTFLGSLRIAFN